MSECSNPNCGCKKDNKTGITEQDITKEELEIIRKIQEEEDARNNGGCTCGSGCGCHK